VTRTVRLLAALTLALPLLLVATPAQADICSAASYQPVFNTDNHNYIQGHGTLTCNGQDVTGMGIKVVLQRYEAIGAYWYEMTTQTASAWVRRSSAGSIAAYTVSLPCLTGQKISYRTRTRWYVDDWYGGSGTNSLYSGYVTLACGR
jgi:hypothetical protein